jgi:hypothetical protein
MTYQGERARQTATENGRCFAVSKVRMDPQGHVSDVLWSEVAAGPGRVLGDRMMATTAEVVDAIHDGAQVAAVFAAADRFPDRNFVVIAHHDGRECIALGGAPSPGRNISDLERLHDSDASAPARPVGRYQNAPSGLPRRQIFAVSKVHLDAAGRITDVLWGQVDTGKNTWATPETVAPVAAAVAALRGGGQVFALFPSLHGHLPERRFVVADYDGGRNTVVLDGPAVSEREVHDMDRLDLG